MRDELELTGSMVDDRAGRSHVAALEYRNFIDLVAGSELGKVMHRLEPSALRTAVREKIEDVYAHAHLYQSGVNLQSDMLAKRVHSLGHSLGELMAQEHDSFPLKGGTESYYQMGQRMAEEFDKWASEPKSRIQR